MNKNQYSRKMLLDLLEKHGTQKKVAKALDVSPSAISSACSRHGIHVGNSNLNRRRKKRSRLHPHLDQIRQWASEGMTTKEMADRLNDDKEVVRRLMVKHNIDRLPQGAQPGEKNHQWKGGRMVDKTGYILIHMPDHPGCNRHGYIREHRLVMEMEIGRLLLPSEVVHHIDGDPGNNHPDNLELFSSNAEHLQAELTGRIPNWTEDGLDRIQQGIQKAAKINSQRASNQMV